MKQRNQKTIDLNEQIFVNIGGKIYTFSNKNSVIAWLISSHKNYIKKLLRGNLLLIKKVTDANHNYINKDYFYNLAYKEINRKKDKKRKKFIYLEEKNYFRARRQSVTFEDEPKVRKKLSVNRSPTWDDECASRKTERCWKNYRGKQHK